MDLRDRERVLDYEIGVSITEERHDPTPSSGPDDQEYTPTAGSRLKPAGKPSRGGGPWTDQLPGKEAVLALAGGIADQIAAMAGQIHTKLAEGGPDAGPLVAREGEPAEIDLADRSSAQHRKASTYAIDTVTVEFGLTASAKSGAGSAIFADVEGRPRSV